MGVWAGNNDHSQMINVTGVVGAAPIWHDSMLVAEAGHPISGFQNPGGLERQTVTYPDGVHTTDWFLPNTYPKFNSHLQPTPIPVDGTVTKTPIDNNPAPPAQVTARPYCTSYNFAFNPPSSGHTTNNQGWW